MLFFALLGVNIVYCLAKGVLPPEKYNETLQVNTVNGVVQGKESYSPTGKSFFSFMGLPYAHPPIGELRFRSPEAVENWSYILDASLEGPCCAGFDLVSSTQLDMKVLGKEDCLYLNLFTSKNPRSNSKPLPVLVFISGGAFISGCASSYRPDMLMEQDIMVIVPNSRTAIFGYLSTEDLNCPGNWAAKDHIAMLKWIQVNIGYFGGDPSKVTISGQSAGGTNVNTLLLSEKANGLFHRAIMFSGSGLCFWSHQTQPRKVAFDIGVALGIETNNSKELINELRKIDEKSLLEGHMPAVILHFANVMTNGLPFSPAVEAKHNESIQTEYTYDLLERGYFNKVPVLMMTSSLESIQFRTVFQKVKEIAFFMYTISPGSMVRLTKEIRLRSKIARQIFHHFLGTGNIKEASENNIFELLTNDFYHRPLRKTAELLSRHTPVFFNYLTYKGRLGFATWRLLTGSKLKFRDFEGVSHSEDISYLFKINLLKSHDYDYTKTDLEDKMMITKMGRLIGNFVKTGNPTPIIDPLLDNVTAPQVTPGKSPYLELGNSFKSMTNNFDDENFQFWKKIYDTYADKPYSIF